MTSKGTGGFAEVRKIIGMTHEQDIVAIDITDRSFILSSAFPKEGSMIYVENLNFIQTSKVSKSDLSFEVFDCPLMNSNCSDTHLIYDLYKLSTKSCYKQVFPSTNDFTSTLKLLTSEKDSVSKLNRHIKYIMT